MSNSIINNLSILYVEDDTTVRESLSSTLKILAKKIYTAKDGLEALNILKDNKIDLIITDIKMPNLDGLELSKKIQDLDLNIPILITTAHDEIDYLHRAIELNVDAFITKPLNISSLIQSITKLAKIIATRKELEKKKHQLEQFKKAVNFSNLIINISKEGDILNISTDNPLEFDLFNPDKIKIANIKECLSSDNFLSIIKSVNDLDIFHKNLYLKIGEEQYTVNITAFANEYDDEIETINLILKDLTKTLKKKDEIIEKLYIDQITKLKNKFALYKRINELEHCNLMLNIINLDDLGKVTKMYGYKMGDEILKIVSKKIIQIIQIEQNDKISFELYQLESDKFALIVLSQNNIETEELNLIANNLITKLERGSFEIEDNLSLDMSFTLGIAYKEEEDILTEALIAKDVAIELKKDFVFYNEITGIKDIFAKNLQLQKKIKKAFDEDRIIPYFQPIVDKDKNIVKYEALARIIDTEENRVLTPFFFLDQVKASKNYSKFTKTIIEKSLKCTSILQKEISINLSFEDISNPEIILFLEEKLLKYSSVITIELLESEGLKDIEKTISFCNLMKDYGAKIAIDDFGAGYSNFEYFFSLPIDKVKIDGSLIKKVNEYKGYVLVEAIVNFCKKLDIKVVAEFVEDEKTFETLKNLGIDWFQGYYFSEPKPIEEL
ncbi:response regulator receiver modulated diguanylate cyclase/phosphodiesterase [Arcobacter nitrofigilis DSM 7299]|uniref:Response regulator receiver modulated diguanylate cyclase/phosphodiesterase n=1 Tax=Arcobacter nitrofigilis (strain ATCC 33309 / DSM 7299 / CCUG 15893 / LMG 7604 / NCTC 12251 / CI) TaxID=572480 RepID=D5V7N8_ARCNC|nr:EAL domain-containing protein [Arcobacter nitrofigilis]ADG94658.1 response regulator receiver modulated diguanylate cyclase/phosphodiesterase [Arcobacter nitrofigilis DSM 7299]